MEINKGLLAAYFFLGHLYDDIYKQDYEDLLAIVSDSDFFIWSSDDEGFIRPADTAKVSEWNKAYKLSGLEVKEKLNSKEMFKVLISYLKFHEKEFDFELKEVIKLVEDIYLFPEKHEELWLFWEQCMEETKKYKVIPSEKIPKVKYMTDKYYNILDIIDESPIHISSLRGDIELTESLLKDGADIDARDKNLWTPLYYATASEEQKMAKYLIEKGANINIEDAQKKTPLHIASEYREVEIASYLIENGANINAEDEKKQTPLDTAYIEKENSEMLNYLIEVGSKIDREYLKKDKERLIKLLLEKGAKRNIEE